MPNDGSSIPHEYEPQTVSMTYNFEYDYNAFNFADVLIPCKNIYDHISRWEKKRMHEREINRWNRKHPEKERIRSTYGK